jgi:DNA-binding response OmpR family regulator
MTEDRPRTILIVDDDAQIRRFLRVILAREGYTIEEAADGNAALKVFQRQPADLIIMDLIMPGKEGIETIIDLRKMNADVKIIAISGGGQMGSQTYLHFASGLGAAVTMSKPIDTGELVATVKTLLQTSA